MSDANMPIARLFGPSELPVRIPDWPEDVGIAVCRIGGRSVAYLPFHVEEAGQDLRKRLPEEGGENLMGLAFFPALRGAPEAAIGHAEDQRITSDLGNVLRSMPRLVEAAHDFAINFEFASEAGISLDGNRKQDVAAPAKPTDELPVGYYPYDNKPDRVAEVISGAILRPVGAAGIDLQLVPEQGMPSREIPPEASVLVREDSLRVAIPVASVLINGQLPKVLRLPAGCLILGQTGGKPVPATVMRRGNFLFVAPEYHAISAPATSVASPAKAKSRIPFKAIGLGLAAIVILAGVVVGTALFVMNAQGGNQTGEQNAVDSLRSNLFE